MKRIEVKLRPIFCLAGGHFRELRWSGWIARSSPPHLIQTAIKSVLRSDQLFAIFSIGKTIFRFQLLLEYWAQIHSTHGRLH